MKKRKICITLACFMALSLLLSGCATTPSSPADTLNVVVTLFPYYDFARIVGGDHVSVTMLLSPGQETHSYEPSPQDVMAILDADVFAYTGGASESYMTDVLSDLDSEKTTVLHLIDLVEPVCTDDDHDHAEGETHDSEDEHIWTDPNNARIIVENLRDTFCRLDSAHADDYTANAAAYIKELESLDQSFQDVVASSQRHLLIFGDRFPLAYFAKAYGLSYQAAFSGCSSEIEPSAATVSALIDTVKQQQIPIIFCIELSNHNIADTIAEATGARVETFYSCQTITKDDFDAGETYLSLMQHNVEVLKEALN